MDHYKFYVFSKFALFSRKSVKWVVIFFKIFTFFVSLEIQIMLNKYEENKTVTHDGFLILIQATQVEKQKPCIRYLVHNRPYPELE